VLLAIMAMGLSSSSAAQGTTLQGHVTGTILSKRLVSKTTLRTGVVLRRYHASVSGLPTQVIDEVTWKLGDVHVSLHSHMLGSYQPSNQSIAIHTLSGWYRSTHPGRVVAALNGDFFTYTRFTSAAIPSSTLVVHRTVYHFGGSAPAVGFTPHGNMVMGNPQALPTRIYLPNGTATVHAQNQAPPLANTDQVGTYTRAGSDIPIPAGYRAIILGGSPLGTSLRGTSHFTNTSGLGKNEQVGSFYLVPAGTPTTKATYAVSAPAPGATSVTVPRHSTVLVMPASGLASTGFDTILAQPTPTVAVSVPDPAWAGVSDVMGGKPQVVKNGTPITTRDTYTTADQWDAEQWRPAIATTTHGNGMFIVIGGLNGGTSTTGAQFARMLAQLNISNAMQFDNRSSTELYVPRPSRGGCVTRKSGTCYTMMPRWERDIPVAVTLNYR